MEAHRTNSFIISLTLHALIAAVVFFTTYYVAKQTEEPVKIFELVAGPPTDIYSTAAPKKGNSIKIELPEIEEESDDAEESAPTPPAAAEKSPPPPPEKTAPPEIKTPKVTTKPQPKPVTKPVVEKTKAKTPTKSDSKISYDEFAKKNPSVKNQPKVAKQGTKTPKYKKIDTTGIREGVTGGSAKSTGGGGGKALTREEQDRMDTYKAFLFQEIRRTAQDDSAGMSDQLLAEVAFDVSASGNISNPRIKRSSGSREFDEFALNVFRRMRNIGPTPDRKSHSWTVNFTMDPNV